MQDKDPLLFVLELRRFDPSFQIRRTYGTPKVLFSFRINPKQIVQCVYANISTKLPYRMDIFQVYLSRDPSLHRFSHPLTDSILAKHPPVAQT